MLTGVCACACLQARSSMYMHGLNAHACRHMEYGDEMLPQTPWHLVQRSHNQQGSENEN